jgi:hypothetical protein
VLLLSVLAASGGWSLSGALREDAGTAKHLQRLSDEVDALQARVGDERRCAERFRSAGEDAATVNRRLLALLGQLTGEGDGSAMADQHDAALSAVISHYYQGFRAAWYGSLDTAADWIESGNAHAREAQRWKATYDEHRTAVERDAGAMTIELQELERSLRPARCERAVDARSGGRPAA